MIFTFAKYWLERNFQDAFTYLEKAAPELHQDDSPDVVDFIIDVCMQGNHDEKLEDCLRDAFVKGDANKLEAVLDDLHRVLQEENQKAKEDGMEVGKREGKRECELNATKKLVQKMLHANIQLETIIEVTGLSASEIEELKNG